MWDTIHSAISLLDSGAAVMNRPAALDVVETYFRKDARAAEWTLRWLEDDPASLPLLMSIVGVSWREQQCFETTWDVTAIVDSAKDALRAARDLGLPLRFYLGLADRTALTYEIEDGTVVITIVRPLGKECT